MSAVVTSPKHSFVVFGPVPDSAATRLLHDFALPVVFPTDIAFQFYVKCSTINEADSIMALGTNKVRVGIENEHGQVLATYAQAPTKQRVGETRVMFSWEHGVPNLNALPLGQCFYFFVEAELPGGTDREVSNRLQRVEDDLYYSLLEYGSDRNIYDFNYCGTLEAEEDPGGEDPGGGDGGGPGGDGDGGSVELLCKATIYEFSAVDVVTFNYAPALRAQYGDIPTVEVWHWNPTTMRYERPTVAVELDGVPTSSIRIHNGGPATGYLKIF